MPNTIDPLTTALAVPALVGALIDDGSLLAKLRDRAELAKLQKQVAEDRATLAEQAAILQKYNEEEKLGSVEFLVKTADSAKIKEKSILELLRPVIESLTELLTRRDDELDADARFLIQDSIDILEGWIALYRDFSDKLVKLAADREGDALKIMRARPVTGKIDHAALSREFIARFPKLRAALAK